MRLPDHGANPQHLFKALNLEQPREIIDFSVNVNPYGMPKSIEQQWPQLLTFVQDYPDPQSSRLKEQLAKKESIDEEQILIGNGAAELIFLLANVFREQPILIVDPTFSEYRTACLAHGCHIESIVLQAENDWQLTIEDVERHLDGKSALFICHPNNPTGVRYEKETLLAIIEAAYARNVVVIIDEAFYDFCLEPFTLVPYVKTYPNLVVLRSFTKMFAIAGIRLGWLASHPTLVSEMAKLKPHWSVNALAEQIGLLCLNEDAFVEQTALKIATERKRMTNALDELGFVVSKSDTNFYVLRERTHATMQPLLYFLMNEGITARHTENFIGMNGQFLRFAIRTEAENDRLLTALKRWRTLC